MFPFKYWVGGEWGTIMAKEQRIRYSVQVINVMIGIQDVAKAIKSCILFTGAVLCCYC